MKIGFTGTRWGCTPEQLASLRKYLDYLNTGWTIEFFCMGDCQGADDQAANIAHEMGIEVHARPGESAAGGDNEFRANNPHAKVTYPVVTHFARNREIVNTTDILIACPNKKPLPEFGGTVYSITHGKKKGRPVVVIFPDGSIVASDPDNTIGPI